MLSGAGDDGGGSGDNNGGGDGDNRVSDDDAGGDDGSTWGVHGCGWEGVVWVQRGFDPLRRISQWVHQQIPRGYLLSLLLLGCRGRVEVINNRGWGLIIIEGGGVNNKRQEQGRGDIFQWAHQQIPRGYLLSLIGCGGGGLNRGSGEEG